MQTREWTVFAQDPSITLGSGAPLLTTVRVPAERLRPGPRGYRVHVIDYDPASGQVIPPRTTGDITADPYADHDKQQVDALVSDPQFHQQNVYGVVMATLGLFERAMGRPLDWSFGSNTQQIKIAPHGIPEANAFYSREDEALIFGYVPALRSKQTGYVFSCLSHDIIAHETTHALLDGLRPHYLRPSSPDQAAFHEGFSDIIAILSVFRFEEVLRRLLDRSGRKRTIPLSAVTTDKLKELALVSLGEELGKEVWPGRGAALRESSKLEPSTSLLDKPEFQHAHKRGEVLVAALLHAFLEVWHGRVVALQDVDEAKPTSRCNVARVAEEGAKAASHLLQIVIRGLDYTPPIDLTFSDYLSALLTADRELVPDDSRYRYREKLRDSFKSFGISPSKRAAADGCWRPPEHPTRQHLTHLHELQRNPTKAFQFVWENADALMIDGDAFTAVENVYPLIRMGPDGVTLRETVTTYVQLIDILASELEKYEIKPPRGMKANQRVRLQGGGTLIFDEFGQLKFNIGTSVKSALQESRIASLHERGYRRGSHIERRFAVIHRDRARGASDIRNEVW